ncbi:helix-turn-helix domain-containing protein [Loigolactobacillus jiayinensis]|uniref:Helix-turn-helix domain-containing protein n=1 Tax=Loigolactobacillus jiayinensis TaxID=2486016 RepID=A0ABW1REN5_9LACO|nr:helix-turn-helix transcriptional regulator [Loigolactobacillus jiayinensis]
MNIAYFVETRKKMGLSQKELCDGVCTQATLSRFEKNGQVPAIKILIKLCNRLNLSLADLFPKVEQASSALNQKMGDAEFKLITMDYTQAQKLLAEIDFANIDNDDQRLRYLYLQGYLTTLLEGETTDALFAFSQILAADAKDYTVIYNLLALTGSGMIYAGKQENEKADFYFNRVLKEIYDYRIRTATDVWRVLNIVYNCGKFYSDVKEYETSDALLNYAYEICADNHVTYYLARVAFRLARNKHAQGKELAEICDYLNDARAFAKLNGNVHELKAIKAYQQKLEAAEK